MTIDVLAFFHPQDTLWPKIQAWLRELQKSHPHRLVPIDITQDPALLKQYRDKTPLLEIGPYVLRAPFDKKTLEVTLAAARDSKAFRESLGRKTPKPASFGRIDRFSLWLSRNFLWAFLLFLTLYVSLPWLAPVFMKVGWYTPARWIYSAYSVTCHQLAFRSWFLFGEQPAYPRAAAGVPHLKTYGQVTGYDEEDLWTARAFVGNEEMGYKVAICERDVAIWGAFWLFTTVFAFLYWRGIRIRALPWYLWIFIGWVPIGLDGFSQLLSQMPLSFLPYRESTPLLRTLTGFIFGLTTAWFMVPMMMESMEETRALLLRKQRLLEARQRATEALSKGGD